jgi:hypothetical protein
VAPLIILGLSLTAFAASVAAAKRFNLSATLCIVYSVYPLLLLLTFAKSDPSASGFRERDQQALWLIALFAFGAAWTSLILLPSYKSSRGRRSASTTAQPSARTIAKQKVLILGSAAIIIRTAFGLVFGISVPGRFPTAFGFLRLSTLPLLGLSLLCILWLIWDDPGSVSKPAFALSIMIVGAGLLLGWRSYVVLAALPHFSKLRLRQAIGTYIRRFAPFAVIGLGLLWAVFQTTARRTGGTSQKFSLNTGIDIIAGRVGGAQYLRPALYALDQMGGPSPSWINSFAYLGKLNSTLFGAIPAGSRYSTAPTAIGYSYAVLGALGPMLLPIVAFTFVRMKRLGSAPHHTAFRFLCATVFLSDGVLHDVVFLYVGGCVMFLVATTMFGRKIQPPRQRRKLESATKPENLLTNKSSQ